MRTFEILDVQQHSEATHLAARGARPCWTGLGSSPRLRLPWGAAHCFLPVQIGTQALSARWICTRYWGPPCRPGLGFKGRVCARTVSRSALLATRQHSAASRRRALLLGLEVFAPRRSYFCPNRQGCAAAVPFCLFFLVGIARPISKLNPRVFDNTRVASKQVVVGGWLCRCSYPRRL